MGASMWIAFKFLLHRHEVLYLELGLDTESVLLRGLGQSGVGSLGRGSSMDANV